MNNLSFLPDSEFMSLQLADLQRTLGILSDVRKELRSSNEIQPRKVLLLCNNSILGHRNGKGYSIANPLSCQRYLRYITSNLGYGDALYMAVTPDECDDRRLQTLISEIEEGQYELIISVGRRLTEWILGMDFGSDEAFILECRSVMEKPFKSPRLSYQHLVVPMIAPGMIGDTEEAVESLACSLAAFQY